MEPTTMDERLLTRLTQALLPRDEVLEAYLFGSPARGQAGSGSDVDVAVYVDEAAAEEGHCRWVVERGLQLCAQNALDIASHISSAVGLDPGSYGSSIDCLVEAGALPRTFGERFRGVAGFRNVLVHGYLEIDLDLLAGMLSERLDDFEEFASHVEHWLAEQANA